MKKFIISLITIIVTNTAFAQWHTADNGTSITKFYYGSNFTFMLDDGGYVALALEDENGSIFSALYDEEFGGFLAHVIIGYYDVEGDMVDRHMVSFGRLSDKRGIGNDSKALYKKITNHFRGGGYLRIIAPLYPVETFDVIIPCQ